VLIAKLYKSMRCHTSSSSSDSSSSATHDTDDITYSLWYVGILLSIAASTATNMGVNLQKYSFMREAKKPTHKKRSYGGQPLWIIGMVTGATENCNTSFFD